MLKFMPILHFTGKYVRNIIQIFSSTIFVALTVVINFFQWSNRQNKYLFYSSYIISVNVFRSNQELIKQLSVPPPGFQDLSFPTKYSQNFLNQCVANTWKQFQSYWKDPPYNAMRYVMTLLYGLVFGTVFWRRGKNMYVPSSCSNLYSNSTHSPILIATISLNVVSQ